MDRQDAREAIGYLYDLVEDHKRRSWPAYDVLISFIEGSEPEMLSFQAILTQYSPYSEGDPGLGQWLTEQFRLALQHMTADEKRLLREECNASASPEWQGFIKAREEKKASTPKA